MGKKDFEILLKSKPIPLNRKKALFTLLWDLEDGTPKYEERLVNYIEDREKATYSADLEHQLPLNSVMLRAEIIVHMNTKKIRKKLSSELAPNKI